MFPSDVVLIQDFGGGRRGGRGRRGGGGQKGYAPY